MQTIKLHGKHHFTSATGPHRETTENLLSYATVIFAVLLPVERVSG